MTFWFILPHIAHAQLESAFLLSMEQRGSLFKVIRIDDCPCPTLYAAIAPILRETSGLVLLQPHKLRQRPFLGPLLAEDISGASWGVWMRNVGGLRDTPWQMETATGRRAVVCYSNSVKIAGLYLSRAKVFPSTLGPDCLHFAREPTGVQTLAATIYVHAALSVDSPCHMCVLAADLRQSLWLACASSADIHVVCVWKVFHRRCQCRETFWQLEAEKSPSVSKD